VVSNKAGHGMDDQKYNLEILHVSKGTLPVGSTANLHGECVVDMYTMYDNINTFQL
jgi:hypothetical protein